MKKGPKQWRIQDIKIEGAQKKSSAHHERQARNPFNTLLKSNVTTWSVGGRCRGSQECGSRFVNFACKFHWRWHAVFGSSHNSEIYNIDVHAQK